MLRSTLLAAARSGAVRAAVEAGPFDPLVDRFIAGTTVDAAIVVSRAIAADRLVTIDHLGEDTTDRVRADANVSAYRTLLRRLGDEGLADRVEVSVKLSAFGQRLPKDGEKIALESARQVCEAAAAVGTTVTVDMEDHTTTDATLTTVGDLRLDFPWVGAVLQSHLRRTEGDCRDLAGPGSRVRLCKGAYDEPESVAYRSTAEVDLSYVRCLKILMAGQGLPMVATHDPRLVAIARHLAQRCGRSVGDYELQMLYGVRPHAQTDLAARGLRVRVYLPYGTEWFGYFMRRLAERPANLAFFARSLLTRG
ncbi:proline dehydrogenase family protein [Pseudonocardia sp. DSM 110487]|uniref:proline dehydrogenase family protein n=1 Tax=Pseudonocardia sp. DSM 110487 TaxID=2865833 RepID=UPI001C6A2C9A|nr:proline dehydrogenase family protein [Pseudonocardia sp. DSM 110487]QYN37316.1 proline dehydrogenase family protein [Pseudonocardia sp. DSM 110487]